MSNPALKKLEVDAAQRAANEAGQLFNETQVKVNEERVRAVERVGWFSAGAVSLSFTVIGFLFSSQVPKWVLLERVSVVGAIYSLLILAWLLLAIAVVSSLFARSLNATFLNYNRACHWASKNKELAAKRLEALAAGVPFESADGKGREEMTVEIADSKSAYEWTEQGTKKKNGFFLRLSNFVQATVYVGAVAGLVCLVVFFATLTHKLVFLP